MILSHMEFWYILITHVMGITNWLEVILYLNIITLMIIPFIKNEVYMKLFSLYMSFLVLGSGFLLLFSFNKNVLGFQFNVLYVLSEKYNIIYHLGLDGLSLVFVLLSLLLLPLCILCSWSTITKRVHDFYFFLFLINFLLIHVFSVLDIFMFYVVFESILIPMFFVIGIWGSRTRKIHAAYQFFLYTLGGSAFMLLSIIYIYLTLGSTHLYVLCNNTFTDLESKLIWLSFFLSFAVKVPMIPVHIWLPEAHVEAPTAGSVLLAGILLKMGTYGMIRFLLPMFPLTTIYFQPLVFVLSLVGIVYSSFTTIRQIDLKKIIAYSSVGHMNFVTLGIVSNNLQGLEGSVFLMLGHGLVSSALFLGIGALYERYHTRVILYYGGLVFTMPLMAFFMLIFSLSNISLPGTSNFIGEFLIFVGVMHESFVVGIIASLGIFLGAIYAMWLYNRIMFGISKGLLLNKYSDLTKKEFYSFTLLFILILFVGILPNTILSYIHLPILNILEY